MANFQTPAKAKAVSRMTKEPLLIPPSPFLERLGYGTGVNVWKLQPSPKGNCPKSPWAIKNIRKNVTGALSNKYQSLLKKEAKILKNLEHENIVGFRGYLTSADGRTCLAMENGGQSLGSLIEIRLEEDLGPFPAKTILKVGLNIARALKYLHTEKNLLHGDIKSHNIVIKGDFEEIKLCDFGVSVKLDNDGVAHGYVGTPVYSAPECQDNSDEPITSKSDIFSFGLVLWEMIALCAPHTQDFFHDETNNSTINLTGSDDSVVSDTSAFLDAMEEKFGTRPPLPPFELGPEYSQVIEVFYCCTEQEASKRPSAEDLLQYLQLIS